MILSAAMMVDFLGSPAAAREIEKAVEEVLAEGAALPADLGGSASTTAVSAAVVAKLSK
jgi:isocitrate/isopropylmalate dehydrogenase